MKHVKKRLGLSPQTIRELSTTELRQPIGADGEESTVAGKTLCVAGCSGLQPCAG